MGNIEPNINGKTKNPFADQVGKGLQVRERRFNNRLIKRKKSVSPRTFLLAVHALSHRLLLPPAKIIQQRLQIAVGRVMA